MNYEFSQLCGEAASLFVQREGIRRQKLVHKYFYLGKLHFFKRIYCRLLCCCELLVAHFKLLNALDERRQLVCRLDIAVKLAVAFVKKRIVFLP